jgi:two-component system LytT family response regulator
VKSAGRLFFLRAEEIDWIESSGNYVCLHVGNETHLLRETMSSLEARARPDLLHPNPPHRHRQCGPDQGAAAALHGEYEVVLRGGARLTLSRSYRDRLQCLLGKDL